MHGKHIQVTCLRYCIRATLHVVDALERVGLSPTACSRVQVPIWRHVRLSVRIPIHAREPKWIGVAIWICIARRPAKYVYVIHQHIADIHSPTGEVAKTQTPIPSNRQTGGAYLDSGSPYCGICYKRRIRSRYLRYILVIQICVE